MSDPEINVRNGTDVRTQADQLGLQSPDSVVVLPNNYFSVEDIDDIRLNQDTITIEKLLEEEGMSPDELIDSSDYPVTHTWSAEAIGPIVHFTADFLVNNWAGVLTVISIIKSYYSSQRTSSVQFTFSVERPDGTYKHVSYEGDPEQLDQVTDLLRESEEAADTETSTESTTNDGEPETVRHDEEESEST